MIKKLLVILTLAAFSALSCAKETQLPRGKVLAEVAVESDAGQVPALVSADGVWKARSIAEWISVDDAWHKGENTVLLVYASNRSIEGLHRPARTGCVVIETADGAQCDTLKIHQRGIEP